MFIYLSLCELFVRIYTNRLVYLVVISNYYKYGSFSVSKSPNVSLNVTLQALLSCFIESSLFHVPLEFEIHKHKLLTLHNVNESRKFLSGFPLNGPELLMISFTSTQSLVTQLLDVQLLLFHSYVT